MPMRRDLGSINAPETHHERRSLGAWVAGHRRNIATLNDRRPLQIAEVHNFGWRGAVFFLLAVNCRREPSHTDQRDTNTSHSNLFHATLLRQKDRGLNWPKDTLPIHRRATQVNVTVAHRVLFWPGRPGSPGNTLKKLRIIIQKSSNLAADGVPPHPPRVPAWPGCRVRRASGTHCGIASVSPHDTGPARAPRAHSRNP